jgi:arylsulfatase A-like enzyme
MKLNLFFLLGNLITLNLFIFNPSLHSQEKPNVLMIVLDDLNDYIGVLGGHPQADTPNIDRLARSGVLFTNAHTTVAVCSPSRASFMTGIAPWNSGCWGFDNWMNNPIIKNNKTLGEYAKDNDYTALQTGKVLHTSRPNMWTKKGIPADYGPMAWDGKKNVIHPSNPKAMAELGALDATFAPLSDVPSVPSTDKTSGFTGWHNSGWVGKTAFKYNSAEDRDLLTDEKSAEWLKKTIQELDENPNSKPFFIGYGLIRPHTPLVVPEKYFNLFPVDKIKLPITQENDRDDIGSANLNNSKSRGQRAFDGLVSGYPTKEDALKAYTQAYLASIKFADDQVGVALDAIENSRFKENTIVLLFSDHGYHISEKEELWKYTLWEESTKVPLIIKDPRNSAYAGSQVSHPVSLLDIFPTVKDLCDWNKDHKRNDQGVELDGNSLKPFLLNPETTDWSGPDVAISIQASWKSKSPQKQHLAARSKDYRYIHYSDGSEELYNHKNDKHEWKNLANNPEFDAIKQKLKSKIMKTVPAKVKNPGSKTVEKVQDADSGASDWKDKYFKLNPEADTNKDGTLTWPEFHAHKKKNKA